MAYDEELADRVRELVSSHGPAEEKRMFGGLAFLLRGTMAVCASTDGGLLVRVGEGALELVGEHVAPMVMGRRESRTWLRVDAAALTTDPELQAWVDRGAATALSLPPHQPRVSPADRRNPRDTP